MTVAFLFLVFTVLLVVGVPVAFAMGLSAVAILVTGTSVPLLVLPQRFFSSLDSFTLMAIPLFILAGSLMNVSGITTAIVRFARALIGHVKGGLGQVNILTSVLFSGISGSAAADVAAVGSMLLPAMKRDGYRPEHSVAITAASAMLGPIIPPSLLMVLYGAMTGLSIGTLFLAGILPGLTLAAMLMVCPITAARGRRKRAARGSRRARRGPVGQPGGANRVLRQRDNLGPEQRRVFHRLGNGVLVGGDAQVAFDYDDTYNSATGGKGPTLPGYTLVNAFAEYSPRNVDNLTLRAEINNLFDETYASRATYGQEFGTVVPLNEPGRSIRLSAEIVF